MMKRDPENAVVIYTDGACDPNPGPGGWAAILRYGRHEKEISGGAPQSTNNRMELQAALAALQALKRPCRVCLYTDSEYLRRGISEWLPTWQRRGWRTSDRKAVRNQDLWQALATEVERHQVEWRWVRGHAGDPLNERADQLARAAIPRPTLPQDDEEAVHLFTRASCLGVQGPGGWAIVVRRGDQITSLSGSAAETTANEMELQAAIQGLTTLTQHSRVHLYTVSKYLHQGITRWVAGWQARGWQTREGQPVRHKTLWLALQEAMTGHKVAWHHLPKDDRPPESDQAATLAAQAARAAQEMGRGSTQISTDEQEENAGKH
jgi:ribonuclease HI